MPVFCVKKNSNYLFFIIIIIGSLRVLDQMTAVTLKLVHLLILQTLVFWDVFYTVVANSAELSSFQACQHNALI